MPHGKLDAPLRLGIFRGVGQQIREHLRETDRIRFDDDIPLRNGHREFMTFAVQPRLHGLDGGLDDRGHLDWRLADLEFAPRDTRDVEEIVQQPAHETGLPLHDLPCQHIGFGIDALALQQMRGRGQRTQRVSQLV